MSVQFQKGQEMSSVIEKELPFLQILSKVQPMQSGQHLLRIKRHQSMIIQEYGK